MRTQRNTRNYVGFKKFQVSLCVLCGFKIAQFIEKLRKKNQSPEQQKQAAHALSLFFESQRKVTNETLSAYVDTEKTVKTTTPSTPFIKGESSNNLSKAAATTPIHSPLPDIQQPHCVTKTEPALPHTKELISKAPSPLPSPSRGEGYNIFLPLRGGDEGEGDVCGFTNDRITKSY